MHHSRNRSFWNKLLISLWSAATLIEEEASTTPAMSKPDLSSSCVDRDRSRSPAVCRKSPKGHQCWIALAEEEMSYIREKEILQKTWFGEGQSIAVKNTLEHAVWAFRQCKNGATPKFVMVFHLPFDIYHDWMHNHKMEMAPEKLHGYRIKHDIVLSDVDPGWTFHEISDIVAGPGQLGKTAK